MVLKLYTKCICFFNLLLIGYIYLIAFYYRIKELSHLCMILDKNFSYSRNRGVIIDSVLPVVIYRWPLRSLVIYRWTSIRHFKNISNRLFSCFLPQASKSVAKNIILITIIFQVTFQNFLFREKFYSLFGTDQKRWKEVSERSWSVDFLKENILELDPKMMIDMMNVCAMATIF